MRALDKKLFRDLWSLKGQVAAIAFVLAAGVATYVLGGQLKTGHTWALQKRPTELGQDKDIYSALGAVA